MTPLIDTPTILIVDDTPSNLSVVVNLFEDRGYRVAIAQDGEEGLQRAQLVQPDLILLDVMMPGIDGFEACRRLKAQESTRDIPVIFMTALASSEHKVRGFGAGAVDYVTKPLQIDEVMARVETHLKLHAAQKRLEEQNAQLGRHREELEQRVAERTAELNESKERYRLVFENSPVSIWEEDFSAVKAFFDVLRNEGVHDIGAYFSNRPEAVRRCAELTKIVDVNLAAVDLHAAGSKEALFAGLLGTFTPESFDAFRRELIGLWNGKTAMAMETVVKTLAGESRNVIVHFSVCPGYERSFAKVLVSLVDITERKQAEQKLAIKGAALAQMHEAAYFVDDQARIFYVNAEASRQLGYSREEFLGMTVMDIAPDWTAEMVVNSWQGLGEGGACTIEAEHRRKDGGIVPVEIGITHLTHEGKAFGLAMARDITERKKAERELLLLNLAMNTSSEAAFLSDAQGRFVYVNDEACRSLGYSREELLSMTPVDIDPDITGEVLTGLLDSIFAHGPTKRPMESRHRTRDGRIFPIEIAASPLRLEGENYCLTMVRDITERKRAERELHLLNRALDNSFDATYLMDTDLRIRYVNEAAVRELGYSREELLSMNLLDIEPNMTREMVQGLMAQTATAGRFPGIIESRHRRKGGEIFPVEIGATLFRYEGEILHLTVVRNIAERKDAERLLHEKEQAIRAVVENSPDTIMRYDNQCRRIYLNPAMEKIFGQPRAQLHGTSPAESSPLPAQYLATIKKVLETGCEQRMESSFRDAQGEARWVDLRLAPEFDADGKVVTVLAIGRDITERKRAEEELAEREQRYREIFDNAVEGMYLLEVTEEGRFRNLDINPALAASTGMPRSAMIGQFVDDTVPEDMGKQIVEKYRRCVAAGATITENIELDLPVGKRHYISTITPIQYEGRIHRLIGISRDITGLKQAERALEESRAQLRGLTARREEAREEERKYIAREVHDELGQILTGLQLNVSVLTHKFAADSPALRDQLQETRVLTDRALAVARNVASALRPAALDMGIVSALEWLVGRFGANTGIHCEVHAEDTEDIQLDESQAIALFRIVQESLTNVARHAKADRIEIDFGMMGDDYSLKVRDNGAGFDEKTAKADSFGLVGMRERALLLGGEVVINSKPGEGTEIEVRIPAHNVSRLS